MVNVIFMGEKALGVKCLEYLFGINNVNIVGVCTRKSTDDVWWGRQYVRDFAKQNNIPILKRKEILNLENVDFIISVLYPYIIEDFVLSKAKVASVNLHQAPLPEYKGCNSVSHAIINNEKKYGCTFHLMSKDLDSGNIIEKKCFDLKEDYTAKELYEITDYHCFEVFKKNIINVVNNSFTATAQNDNTKSYIYDRDSLKNKEVSLDMPFEEMYSFVRANEFPPFEPAYIEKDGKKIYLITKPFKKY